MHLRHFAWQSRHQMKRRFSYELIFSLLLFIRSFSLFRFELFFFALFTIFTFLLVVFIFIIYAFTFKHNAYAVGITGVYFFYLLERKIPTG